MSANLFPAIVAVIARRRAPAAAVVRAPAPVLPSHKRVMLVAAIGAWQKVIVPEGSPVAAWSWWRMAVDEYRGVYPYPPASRSEGA